MLLVTGELENCFTHHGHPHRLLGIALIGITHQLVDIIKAAGPRHEGTYRENSVYSGATAIGNTHKHSIPRHPSRDVHQVHVTEQGCSQTTLIKHHFQCFMKQPALTIRTRTQMSVRVRTMIVAKCTVSGLVCVHKKGAVECTNATANKLTIQQLDYGSHNTGSLLLALIYPIFFSCKLNWWSH